MQPKLTSVAVRAMSDRDVPQAAQMEREYFAGDAYEEWVFTAHLREPDQFALAAELDNKFVGYMLYGIRSDHIYIDSIAVYEAARRRGAGEAMLRHLLKQLPLLKQTKVRLHLKPGNPAQELYEKVGFAVAGSASWFYDDGSKPIEMRYPS